jgi:hypothetical protein
MSHLEENLGREIHKLNGVFIFVDGWVLLTSSAED